MKTFRDFFNEQLINESFDKINGKLVKNESKYFHYTTTDSFHKIVNSFIKGEGLKGVYYPANTNTYGELTPKGKKLPNEVCLVRSDRLPDNIKHLKLSGSIGDIKFTFKEDKIENKFGKIKPIGEYPVQDKKWIIKSVEDCKNKLAIKAPIALRILEDIKKHYHSLTKEQMDEKIKKLSIFINNSDKKYLKEIMDNYEEYHNGRNIEHMESRIRVPEGKFITLDFINQILIPDYLKNNKNILEDIKKLKEKGFDNIAFYKCKYPKE